MKGRVPFVETPGGPPLSDDVPESWFGISKV
jgi:hypothetical protein